MGLTIDIQDHSEEFIREMDAALRAAFEEIGQNAEAYAKAACPVDTGRLRNSISHKSTERMMQVGTNVEYAPAVELGTSRQKPQPYLRPSVEDYIDKYQTIIVNELKNI